MAFRKRVYAGSYMGTRKRARYAKRRYGRFKRKRRNYAMSSQRGNTVFTGYRGRKMKYRKYINNMFNSTRFKEHHRSINMTAIAATAPLSNTAANVYFTEMINDSFWSLGGGSLANVTPDEDIFIRGGISTITFRNNGSAPVTVKVWKLFKHSAETFSIPLTQSAMWDPTTYINFERFYNIRQSFSFVIENDDQNTLMHYVNKQKIEISDFNDDYRRELWCFSINCAAGVLNSVTVLRGHNISFVTDRL